LKRSDDRVKPISQMQGVLTGRGTWVPSQSLLGWALARRLVGEGRPRSTAAALTRLGKAQSTFA
jgi:hypothetical protein